MADQEIALRVNAPAPPAITPFDPATSLTNAQTILGNQTALQAGQTRLQMLGRENAGQDIQFRSQLIRDAAAHALDADSWDKAMSAAAQRGAPEAQQYVGRYTPLLQQRLFDAYGGTAAPGVGGATGSAAATGTGGTPTDQFDRTFQNATPQQMGEILRQGDMFLKALSLVKDQGSQDQAAAALRAAGIPDMALRGPFSPLKVVQLWNEVSQRNNYLAGRLTPGAPAPPIKTEMQNIGDVGYDPYTHQPMTPGKPQKIGVDQFGLDIYGVPDASVPGGFRRIDASTLPTGSGVSIADAAKRIQGVENTTGNPAAVNPRSTATGNGQFLDSTWLDTIKEARPDLTKGLSDQQILALRANPQLSAEMTQRLAIQNAAVLSGAGLPITTASLTLAHRFGAEGATKILNAAPDTPMEKIVSPAALKANPELKGQTAGGYTQGLVRQVGNDPVNAGQTGGADAGQNLDIHGEDYLKTLPDARAGIVRAIVEGRAPFPSGFIMKTPYGQWLSQAITQAEPGFNAANWTMRNQVYKEWNAGGPNSPAGTLTAGNTAIQHLGHLSDAAEKLENWSGWGLLQGPLNLATLKEREISQDPRITTFDSVRNKYIEEATKFYRGTGGNETDLQRDIAALNAAQSPEQLRQAIATQAELMQSKINALQDRWTHANTLYDGRVIAPPFPIVQKESQSALDKINQRRNVTGSAPVPAAKATPTVPTPVDPRDAAALRANSHNPAWAAAIDDKYGRGAAAKI